MDVLCFDLRSGINLGISPPDQLVPLVLLAFSFSFSATGSDEPAAGSLLENGEPFFMWRTTSARKAKEARKPKVCEREGKKTE